MIRQALRITLLEDCVFSASTATAGGHKALDRIPGQALLGAAAARIYGELDADQSFAIFHSGRFRFGEGLPCCGTSRALPMPLSWHHYKGADPLQPESNLLEPDRVLNLLHARPDAARQPVQLRKGYVLDDGRWLKPQTSLRLKTAIAPETGRAAEAQLFGYASLSRGQQFLAELQCDDDLESAMQTVVDSLAGERLLGRSRSAEYGCVQIERIETEAATRPGPTTSELHLLLVSDLALVDEDGQPTLEPRPQRLGLGEGEIDWKRTWLRTRRYSMWNQYRNGYGCERAVINAGSVITFKLCQSLDTTALETLAAGVGCHRECGLGQVLINPDVLTQERLVFKDSIASSEVPDAKRPDDPLIAWLESRTGVRDIEIDRLAEQMSEHFMTQIERARRLAGVASDQWFGPSKAQWGTVLEAARHTPGERLFARLFEGEKACVKPSAEGWREELRNADGTWETLAEALAKALRRESENKRIVELDDREYAALVRRLARRMLSQVSVSSQRTGEGGRS
ncbi:hypothetical protein HFP89_01855 [Wenzhouxiangella sp. XN79A]|uniref:hypothetical protein n=1 Tax=Wenzhouxiangella sp. XN79A TaxID=2724193 RepID=UPI00144A8ECF|nr:hypothetical protein [Wenzhouxiangella sp. XN79A]NKI33908.1 hypothetical protein [Wenzhouxiangella sp. XN79A]